MDSKYPDLKDVGYRLLKLFIKAGLYLYYGRIKISGLENVPRNKPVLFLPNHQAALMDVLLMVTDCNRKPYFLTRSDIFGNTTLTRFFTFLRMLPIYRIRDGRDALRKNQAVFEKCARLFQENEALVMFPEGNHNLERRVRPLSKGFTRILFNALEKLPKLDIQVVPVGMNYENHIGFPDRVALYYGKSIKVNALYDPKNPKKSVDRIKKAVSGQLKVLTTHIEEKMDYKSSLQKLEALQVDYLQPIEANAALHAMDREFSLPEEPSLSGEPTLSEDSYLSEDPSFSSEPSAEKAPSYLPNLSKASKKNVFKTIIKGIFILLNFPVIAIWRSLVKPKVWEPEFTATLRFGYSMVVYPFYYMLLGVIFAALFDGLVAAAIVGGLLLYNSVYARWF